MRSSTTLSLLLFVSLAAACSAGAQTNSDATTDALDATESAVDVSAPDATSDQGSDVPSVDVSNVDAAQEDRVQPPADVQRPGLGPPYPIVLHHGFAGWRDIGPINYYFNVARDLRSRGETVYEAAVAPFDSSPTRARMLAPFIDRVLAETGKQKVVLIAHSQGGLDARYLISTLGYGDRVAALVTVSTPHLGTRVADAIDSTVPGGDALFNAIGTLLGVSYNEARARADLRASLESLSLASSMRFNRENPDDPRVAYYSWAGRSNLRDGSAQCGGARFPNDASRRDPANPLLLPTALYIEQGDATAHVNDGLVEVASARWGTFLGCVPADHFEEIGQVALLAPNLAGFNHLTFYRDTVALLRAAGY